MKVERCLITMGLAIAISALSISYAAPNYSVMDYAFNNNPDRYNPSVNLKEFMVLNGVTKKDINTLIKAKEKYSDSLEELWEEIELGYSILDELLFSDSDIRYGYNKALERLGKQDKAYLYIKKSFVNDSTLVTSKVKKLLKNQELMINVFKKKYKRTPTEMELKWLGDMSTLKYALYGGYIGEEIDESQKEQIQNGMGYAILGLNEFDIDEYLDFMQLRSKLEAVEVMYNSSVLEFKDIQEDILSQVGIDIYKSLSTRERLEIHSKSVRGLFFDRGLAFKYVKTKLKNKYPNMGDISQTEDNTVYPNLDNKNPYNEMNNSLVNNKINKILAQMFDALYESMLMPGGKPIEHICFKYKDIDINTGIIVDEMDFVMDVKVELLLRKIQDSLGAVFILGESDLMMLMDGSVQVYPFNIGNYNEIELKNIKSMLMPYGIEIYKKKMNVSDSSKDNEVSTEMIIRTLVVETENKKYSITLGMEGEVTRSNIQELLEKNNIKIVFFDSAYIVLRDGRVYTPSEIKEIPYKLSLLEIKKLFRDIGLNVTSIKIE